MTSDFSVNIFLKFHSGAWGGGNQFLKALREELIKKKIYEHNPEKATCVLFNSHHNFKELLKFKLKFQHKLFFHRIDGPVYLIRGTDYHIDKRIFLLNKIIADGTIFQSNWSRDKNYILGLRKNLFETEIMNASDFNIFFPLKSKNIKNNKNTKYKLIATSWSSSYSKGYLLYRYLDKNLNFNQYSMKFVGNSPIEFKNIENIKPVNSIKLAYLLREGDIFIIGSVNDPCSNSLIEALTCGLPSIVMNDGGHPEILKKGGETFNSYEECLEKIDMVRDNYEIYRNNIRVPDIKDIAEKYIAFMKNVYDFSLTGKYRVKHLSKIDYWNVLLSNVLLQQKIVRYASSKLNRILIPLNKIT